MSTSSTDGNVRVARAFRVALVLLPLGVLGNLAYTLLATDRVILDSLGQLPRGYLLVALLLALTPWLTGTLRLLVWTRFLHLRIPLRELWRMTLVVDLGSAATPTAVGGEAFKWGLLVRYGVRPGAAAALALLPKIEDGIFFLVALPVAIVWSRAWEMPSLAISGRLLTDNVLTIAATAAGIAIASWIIARVVLGGSAGDAARKRGLLWWGGLRRRLRRAWREARAVFRLIARTGKTRMALTLTFTAVQWLARYSVISALALFLGIPFDPVLFWVLQWVVFTIMSFIPTPGATGGAELGFTAVYASLLPGGTIGIATAGWRLFTFYVPVTLAALLFPLLAPRERSPLPQQRVNVSA